MKTFSFILTGMVIPCLIFAQQRLLTMEEASIGSQKLLAKNLAQLQWNGESDTYFYVAKNALVRGNMNNSNRDTILKLQMLNEKLKKLAEDTLGRFPAIAYSGRIISVSARIINCLLLTLPTEALRR